MSPDSRPRRADRSSELHALVLAGGSGRRLQPLTRRLFGEAIPKQFCRFGTSRSLLQKTIDRVAPAVPAARVVVIIDRSQSERARPQLAGYAGLRLIEQPCDRGTAAGVLLPLLDLLERAPDATVLLAASDHGVANEEAYLATIRAAQRAVAEDPERIVLIGAEPEAANCDYGWIVRVGLADATENVDAVERFVEKPGAAEAEALFSSGRALWNTMVMVARGAALLELMQQRLPESCRLMNELLSRVDALECMRAETYGSLPSANFSADVIGAAHGLHVLALPLDAGWTDLGTEARLSEWMRTRGVSTRRSARAPVRS